MISSLDPSHHVDTLRAIGDQILPPDHEDQVVEDDLHILLCLKDDISIVGSHID